MNLSVFYKKTTNILALTLLTCQANAQLNFQKDSLDYKLQQWLPDVKPKTPGYVIGIMHKDKIIYTRSAGSASLQSGVPLSEQSVFNIGSVSKQFAGYSILQLEAQGKLDINDSVKKYLPEYPVFQLNPITVRNLLQHTSGLREMFELLEVSDKQVYDLTMDQVKYILLKQRKVNFAPGEFYDYINTNYFFLALIVEKLTDMPYPKYIQENIFSPLDMKTATVLDMDNRLVPNRTEAYIRKDSVTFLKANPIDDFYGPCSIYCTVFDLLKWGSNFIYKKIGSAPANQKFITKGSFRQGVLINYGYGLFVDQYRGITIIEHAGSRLGYTSQFLYLPEKDVVVVILSNTRNFPVRDIYRKIMDYLLKDQFPEQKSVQTVQPILPTPVTINPKELAVYAGTYWNSFSDLTRKVYEKNGSLFYQRTPTNESQMIPINKTTFLMKIGNNVTNNRISFSKQFNTSKWRIRFLPERGDSSWFEQVDTVNVQKLKASMYTGMFYCDELDTKFELQQQNDKLVLIIKGWEPMIMEPVFSDYFYNTDFGGSLYFKKDKKGKVVSFIYSSARTKYLEFKKIYLEREER